MLGLQDQHLVDEYIKHSEERNYRVYYVQVHRDGELTGSYSRLSDNVRFPAFSITKGFVSCAAGIAEHEGLIKLNEKLVDIFPEYVPANANDYLKKVTIEDCLMMAAGQKGSLFMSSDKSGLFKVVKDWIKYFFEAEFVHEPGTYWEYSNFNTYMVSCAIERRARMNLLEYLKPRLFYQIGIGNPEWRLCPMGHVNAGAGLMLDIEDLSNYAELLLNYGNFRGKQIVPESYMRKASSNLIDNSKVVKEDNKPVAGFGYGYQFILNPPQIGGYRSEGAKGQQAIAIPAKNATVTLISMDDESHAIGTLLFEDIVNRL